MDSPLHRFAFIDAVHAAEALHIATDGVLDLVASGKLRAFGGKPSNPFLRSSDIVALIEEMGVSVEESPKRTKSAAARVQTRLTADARWADVSESDIREWAARADSARRQAARTAALTARQRLDSVLQHLDETTS